MNLSLRSIATSLGGDVVGGQVLAPGPNHSRKDRSLAVRLSAAAPGGLLIHSFANDHWRDCRDYVARRLGIGSRRPEAKAARPSPHRLSEIRREAARHEAAERIERQHTALFLWSRRHHVGGSPAEVYLRQARHYSGRIPATLGYLPARGKHGQALIAAFGIATELDEPGVLAIADDAVLGVHLTKLNADGTGKAEGETSAKIMIGKSAGFPVCIAATNDLLGLAITEGIEDALSVYQATGLGAWAAGSADRMPTLADKVPEYIECVTIWAHPEPAGQAGAVGLADKLLARGIEVIVQGIAQ